MAQPRFSFVPIMDHEVHVTEWGDPDAPALVMWHGLARTGRDFDELAAALSDQFHVLCPDTIGRGLSSWSQNPEAEYSIEYYSGIAADLLDHFEAEKVGWIGTSMGGLIGMRMASGPLAERLDWLVINDISPEVPQAAIDRIVAYSEQETRFATLSEAERWFRSIYVPFGPASDAFWQRMTRHSVRRLPDGSLTMHVDPRVTVQFTASASELTSWDRYEAISLPMHLFWGKTSDLVPEHFVARMRATGPKPEVTVMSDCGHAPSLSRPEDQRKVREVIAALIAKSSNKTAAE